MANRRKRRAQSARQSGRRQLYDQAKDPRAGQPTQKKRRRAHTGYQEQTLTFEAPAGVQRARADNGIEFPAEAARRAQPRRAGQPARAAQAARPQKQPTRLRPAREPVRREARKKRRLTRAQVRRRRIARRVTAFALLLCVIAAGVYLTVTMLFKINSIEVQTADGTAVSEAGGYSSEQILQVLGVHLEDNIFSFDPAERAAVLEKQFPLLEQIEVQRRYPTGVVVRVTESVPTWAMQTQSGWITLSATLKILAQSAEQPALPTLYGGEPVSSAPGDQLTYAVAADESASAASGQAEAAQDDRLASLATLLAALEQRGLLADITRVEFADTEQMAFLYQGRISVLLGTLNELDYKLDFARYLLQNEDGKGCAPTDTGRLDCSHVRSDGTLRPILAQGEPTLPSGYVQGAVPAAEQPAEQAEPTEQTAEAAAAEPAAETAPAEAAPAEPTQPVE